MHFTSDDMKALPSIIGAEKAVDAADYTRRKFLAKVCQINDDAAAGHDGDAGIADFERGVRRCLEQTSAEWWIVEMEFCLAQIDRAFAYTMREVMSAGAGAIKLTPTMPADLPDLQGTEKQIAWAEDIRIAFYGRKARADVALASQEVPVPADSEPLAIYRQGVADALGTADAKWWIETGRFAGGRHFDRHPEDFVHEMVEKGSKLQAA